MTITISGTIILLAVLAVLILILAFGWTLLFLAELHQPDEDLFETQDDEFVSSMARWGRYQERMGE